MKKVIYLVLIGLIFACGDKKGTVVSISNTSDVERNNEVIEVDFDKLADLFEKGKFVITNSKGAEIAHQITYDNKLIFPVTVKAYEVVNYYIKAGTPSEYKTIVYGKHYPERLDDIAWENDRIAFRTYGPALQATGERAFGYDIWVKRVSELVVEQRYATELNPETQAKIKELRKTNPQAAQELYNSVSYHIDHGNGLDYYAVGPTLGAGASALLDSQGAIVYPYCYKAYEIVDNGPLRFSVKLTYNPLTVNDNTGITETRLISLDAGSQLNKISIRFDNLLQNTPVATGIALHEPSEEYVLETTNGFIAYADPADDTNGQTYVGAVFPDKTDSTQVIYFPEKEKKERKANGHIVAVSNYKPGSTYTYYAGGGWNKWGFENHIEWFNYIKNYAKKVREPLSVTIQ